MTFRRFQHLSTSKLHRILEDIMLTPTALQRGVAGQLGNAIASRS